MNKKEGQATRAASSNVLRAYLATGTLRNMIVFFLPIYDSDKTWWFFKGKLTF